MTDAPKPAKPRRSWWGRLLDDRNNGVSAHLVIPGAGLVWMAALETYAVVRLHAPLTWSDFAAGAGPFVGLMGGVELVRRWPRRGPPTQGQ